MNVAGRLGPHEADGVPVAVMPSGKCLEESTKRYKKTSRAAGPRGQLSRRLVELCRWLGNPEMGKPEETAAAFIDD